MKRLFLWGICLIFFTQACFAFEEAEVKVTPVSIKESVSDDLSIRPKTEIIEELAVPIAEPEEKIEEIPVEDVQDNKESVSDQTDAEPAQSTEENSSSEEVNVEPLSEEKVEDVPVGFSDNDFKVSEEEITLEIKEVPSISIKTETKKILSEPENSVKSNNFPIIYRQNNMNLGNVYKN